MKQELKSKLQDSIHELFADEETWFFIEWCIGEYKRQSEVHEAMIDAAVTRDAEDHYDRRNQKK